MNHFFLTTLALFIGLSCSLTPNHALADRDGTGHSGGGGDEIFFHSLATQIESWLQKYQADGTLDEKLGLKQSKIAAKDLVSAYENALRVTPDVKFVPQAQLQSTCNSGDSGSCLLLANPTRICVNHGSSPLLADGTSFIRCNADLFDQASGDLQFSITFHEYLGVAGIEQNGTSDIRSYSQYPISKYLMQFAEPKAVVRYELGEQKTAVANGSWTGRWIGKYTLINSNGSAASSCLKELEISSTTTYPDPSQTATLEGVTLPDFKSLFHEVAIFPGKRTIKDGLAQDYGQTVYARTQRAYFKKSGILELRESGRAPKYSTDLGIISDIFWGTRTYDRHVWLEWVGPNLHYAEKFEYPSGDVDLTNCLYSRTK